MDKPYKVRDLMLNGEIAVITEKEVCDIKKIGRAIRVDAKNPIRSVVLEEALNELASSCDEIVLGLIPHKRNGENECTYFVFSLSREDVTEMIDEAIAGPDTPMEFMLG